MKMTVSWRNARSDGLQSVEAIMGSTWAENYELSAPARLKCHRRTICPVLYLGRATFCTKTIITGILRTTAACPEGKNFWNHKVQAYRVLGVPVPKVRTSARQRQYVRRAAERTLFDSQYVPLRFKCTLVLMQALAIERGTSERRLLFPAG